MKDRTEAASGIDGVQQEVTYHVKQWCSGAGTHRNAVPVNILGPERRSGSYPSSQAERYCCSVPANVCRQDRSLTVLQTRNTFCDVPFERGSVHCLRC